jgi:hypothetical protein
MTSCDGVLLPREHGELVFHGPRGGIDESVMANGMENVPPGHAMIVTTCKPLHCRFALLTINEHSISDGFCAVPAAASAVPTLSRRFTPLMLAGTPVQAPIVTGMYADDQWDVVEVARGPVDPLWRNRVVDYACTRLYGGADVDKTYSENEVAIRQYQRRVGQAIKLSQGPRTFKACVEMTATYCAVGLCSGRAQAVVGQFLDLNRRLPTMRELFFLLDEDVYALYVSTSFADQKQLRTSSSETVSSQEEVELLEEVSSALPGHRWIPPYITEDSDFGDVSFEDDFGNGF